MGPFYLFHARLISDHDFCRLATTTSGRAAPSPEGQDLGHELLQLRWIERINGLEQLAGRSIVRHTVAQRKGRGGGDCRREQARAIGMPRARRSLSRASMGW
jgi:hypothetical protein